MDLLECPICLFLMCEPATMSCGHSFCRSCLGNYLPSRCPACKERFKQRDAKNIKNTILIFSVIEKCCPEETRMKCHILEKLKTSEFTEALRIADEGIQLAPGDVSLKVWRAEASMGLRLFSDALRDLEDLCCIRPKWTEGFFRKGNVLLEMGRQSEALIQFHRCLKLQADFTPAKIQIKKILEAEGMSVPEEVPQILQVVSEYLRDLCPPITSLFPDGPTQSHTHSHAESLRFPQEEGADGDRRGDSENGSKVKHGTSTECCLSLCQAVSFLPTAEDDEEMMMRKEERHSRGGCSLDRRDSLSVLTVSDFECPLCIRLFYEPVTTPCGHTFCRTCLERSLDHNLRCPLCKQPLQEYFKNRKYNPTVLLQEIMSRLFPLQLAERKQVHETEMAELSNLTKDIPIFVCAVAYPGVPCPLHIFEPRYRLMMRRCMETGTRKFGMCSYEHGKGFADYGCMLEIHSLEVLPDGRSYVDCVGGSRFRVLKRGQRDGYHTADIEYMEDHKAEGSELELLQSLHDSVYEQAQDWYTRLNTRLREQISRQYGTMPDKDDNIQASINGPAWCWWLLSVLQLDPAYQTTVLSLPSLKDRLGHLRIVLEYFSQS
ncbi:LON peptidase N-terminal domain and RING finger protein 1 [Salmo salar]|uniref:LON peptidase N-terminal domain and RING finger protein 1 n=1 Tax=Salmo salar TaxID=8030 RepID=A0A1S3SVI0_SALSA|nr:LON peptidase N-terminal domain and RING finger protein 1 [Salmo salar]|eukprot:XP_014068350.1 PREDICTED: LON peptidase N-terminal domain and RING finger protein 1-like [Salmo salar]